MHQNPVESGLVYKAEDYVYSSTRDDTGEKGLLDDIVAFEFFDFLLCPHERIRAAAGV